MPLRLNDVGPPVEEQALKDWQWENACLIPVPYCDFLLSPNGGRPERMVFRFRLPDGSEAGDVLDRFLGIGVGDLDLQHYVRSTRSGDRIPRDLFPIASTACGNLVLMGLPGPRAGRIYFWDHELEASKGEPPTEENVAFVASSLTELIDKLEPLLSTV